MVKGLGVGSGVGSGVTPGVGVACGGVGSGSHATVKETLLDVLAL